MIDNYYPTLEIGRFLKDDLSFKEYLSDFLVRGGLNKYFNQHQEEISLLVKKTPWQELRIWSLLAIAVIIENCRYAKARGKRHSCKSEEVLGNFTFLYIPLNFYVHLLKPTNVDDSSLPNKSQHS